MPDIDSTWGDPEFDEEFENFVGRVDKLAAFKDNFAGDRPKWMVLSITGEGGVGKSTLLQQYIRMAKTNEIEANLVLCDERQMTPVDVMGFVAEELTKLKIINREFKDLFEKYCQLRLQAEKDPNFSKGLLDIGAHVAADIALDGVSRIPGFGSAGSDNIKKAAGDAFAGMAQHALSKLSNNEDDQLLRYPAKKLTPLFVELINQAARENRLVIMLDVFEHTGKLLTPWLIDLFRRQFGDISARIAFVISGRDQLGQEWTVIGRRLRRLVLEPFELKETHEYLINRDITDGTLIEQIHKDTAGLPVLVELLAGTYPQPGLPLPDISRDAVERFLYWTRDEKLRHVALLAAVPRQFNQDILSTALDEDATLHYSWLMDQSYIRTSTERGCFYHEKVRELMLRHLRNTVPSQLTQVNLRLTSYYSDLQAQLFLEGIEAYQNVVWRKWELERLYHKLRAEPHKTKVNLVNGFLCALHFRWWYSGEIADCGQQIASEEGNSDLIELSERIYNCYRVYEQDKYGDFAVALNSLEKIQGLDTQSKVILFERRGYAMGGLGKYREALDNFNRAIELDDKMAQAIAMRGQTLHELGKNEEALADFDRAIELDEKMDWAIAMRGQILRELGRYEEALADFDRAIELDEKMDWAIASRGQILRELGRYEEALTDFNRAIELDEKMDWAIASRGRTLRALGRYEEALIDFDRAIELDEKMDWAIASRGETLRLMGKYEEALADLNRAIELDGEYHWAYYRRGETYRYMQLYDQAITDLTKTISDGEPDAGDFVCRSAAYLALGQQEAAQADLEKAMSFEAKEPWDHYYRAVALLISNRITESLAELEVSFTDLACRVYSLADDLLNPVRDLPEFKSLLDKYH
jgi:tetratricopeptide (TPR) repeat protein